MLATASVTARQQAQSPSYFSNSSADSLMNFEDNFEDSLLMTGLNASPVQITASTSDAVAPRKTPLRSCQKKTERMKTPVNLPNPAPTNSTSATTPVLTRSARKRMQRRPVPQLATVEELKDNKPSTNAPIPNNENKNTLHGQKKNNDELQNPTGPSNINKPLIDNFDEQDDFDELISTQPDILLGNTKPNNDNTKKPPFTRLQNDKKQQQQGFSTPLAKKKPSTPDLLDAENDGDDFDDLLASFDMDEIKCKSQDTFSTTLVPAATTSGRLTESQRKLKTKCHTSPLPLNYNQKKLLDRAAADTSFVPIAKPAASTSSATDNNNKLDNNMQTLSIHSPSACTRKTNFQNHKPLPNKNTTNSNRTRNTATQNDVAVANTTKVNKIINNNNISVAANTSFVRTGMVTKACRKPFVPPKQSQCHDVSSTAFSDMTLDLSAIQGSTNHDTPSGMVFLFYLFDFIQFESSRNFLEARVFALKDFFNI